MKHDRHIKTATFIILLFLATVLLHSIEFRTTVWNIDEYIFATGGQKILGGGVLYRDFGDNKPPLIYYTFALLRLISGSNFMNFVLISKLWTILIVFLAAVGCYAAGKNLYDRKLGMTAALLYSAYSICAGGGEVLGGRTEIYAALMGVTSIFFFTRKKFSLSPRDLAAAGFFISVSALYNTRFGIILAVYLLFILYKRGVSRSSVLPIITLVASIVPLFAAVPLCYYCTGTFDYYVFWQSTALKHYLNALPFFMKILSGFLVLYFLAGIAPVTAFAIQHIIMQTAGNRSRAKSSLPRPEPGAGAFRNLAARLVSLARAVFLRGPDNESFAFIMMLLVLSYLAFFTGGIPGVRYFYILYLPLALLGARGIINVFGHLDSGIKNLRFLKAMLVLFLVTVPMLFYAIHMNTRRQTLNETLDEYRTVVEYIRSHTGESDRIYAWSDMHPVYLISNRTMATCMIYPSEFLLRYYYYNGDFRQGMTAWDMFLAQLREGKPKIIIDDSGGFSANKGFLYLRKNEYVDEKLRELRDFVKENYRAPEAIGKYHVYLLKTTRGRHPHK